MTERVSDIRPSPIAGSWYPGNPLKLREEIQHYISAVPNQNVEGYVRGLIVPHAGYKYSGQIAAYGFAQVAGKSYDRIVILSPFHAPARESILTSGHQAYQTPLGIVPIDHEILSQINTMVNLNYIRNDPEHSLEIELPFLQVVIQNDFKVVPLMLRTQDNAKCKLIGDILAAICEDEVNSTLFIASTDLSHFFPGDVAQVYDRAMMDRIEAFDPPGVIEIENENKGFACGRAAIATLLYTVQRLGANGIRTLYMGNSGDITGDYSSVVGYASAVITQL